MDAKVYLQSYGWKEGDALQTGGLKKPILVKHKKDTKGLGHDTNDADLWWERLFDGQLKNLDVSKAKTGEVTFATNEIAVQDSIRKANSPLYKMFVKGQGLAGTVGNTDATKVKSVDLDANKAFDVISGQLGSKMVKEGLEEDLKKSKVKKSKESTKKHKNDKKKQSKPSKGKEEKKDKPKSKSKSSKKSSIEKPVSSKSKSRTNSTSRADKEETKQAKKIKETIEKALKKEKKKSKKEQESKKSTRSEKKLERSRSSKTKPKRSSE